MSYLHGPRVANEDFVLRKLSTVRLKNIRFRVGQLFIKATMFAKHYISA